MILDAPQFLWLLGLVPVLARLRWRGGGARRGLVAMLSGLCTAALVVALARPVLIRHEERLMTVLVVDVGPATSPTAVQDALGRLGGTSGDVRVIAFSNRAEVMADPAQLKNANDLNAMRQRLSKPLAADDLPSGGGALAAALQLAGAQVPSGGRGGVVVFSGGITTRGDAEAEAYRLAERGIAVTSRVETVPVADDVQAIVRHVSAPAAGVTGLTVPIDVTVESRTAGAARVTLNGITPPVSAEVKLEPGVRAIRLLVPLTSPGLTTVVADVSLNSHPSPATMPAAIHVGPAARVLLVSEDSDQAGVALGRLLGRSADIESTTPAGLLNRPLDDYNAIVLADVPADALTAASEEQLRHAVERGTGLLLTGAARSFGPGGYDDSALAPMLPVRMPQQAERIDPSTTLVLIIDTSGSMEDFQRMDLAKEVARLAISHLKPHDKIGIVEFYGGKRWAAPIQSAANTSVINRALSRLTAGGMTTLYPAVEEAAFALDSVETQGKHVLIISDGGVETAPFAGLLRQMHEDGVAVSAVAVAPTPGQPNMMPDLARWGGGRLYSVPDRFALPDITLKQPQVSLTSSLVRNPAKVIGLNDPLIRPDDVATWKAINGYVRTVAKPTADVLLRTADGDPLLTRWRWGAGFVAALPSQLGSTMTEGLANEPGFATLVAGLFRQIEAGRENGLDVRPVVRPAGLEVDVTTLDRTTAVATGPLRLTLTDHTGASIRTVDAQPVGIGRWNVLWPGVTAGNYDVIAAVAGTAALGHGGVAVAGPRDLPRLTADADLLARICAFADMAAHRSAGQTSGVETFLELRNALAAAALILLVFEVAARRWPERGETGST